MTCWARRRAKPHSHSHNRTASPSGTPRRSYDGRQHPFLVIGSTTQVTTAAQTIKFKCCQQSKKNHNRKEENEEVTKPNPGFCSKPRSCSRALTVLRIIPLHVGHLHRSGKSFRTPDWCASDSSHLQTRVEKGLTQDWVKGRLSVPGRLASLLKSSVTFWEMSRSVLRSASSSLRPCLINACIVVAWWNNGFCTWPQFWGPKAHTFWSSDTQSSKYWVFAGQTVASMLHMTYLMG